MGQKNQWLEKWGCYREVYSVSMEFYRMELELSGCKKRTKEVSALHSDNYSQVPLYGKLAACKPRA